MDPSPSRPLALVTGGSSGIESELARQLGERGYDGAIAAQDTEKLDVAAETLRQTTSGEIRMVAADLAAEASVETLHAEVQDLGRPVELLCANAGVGIGGGDFLETDLAAELRLVDLNVRGQVHLAKLVARAMAAQGPATNLMSNSMLAQVHRRTSEPSGT